MKTSPLAALGVSLIVCLAASASAHAQSTASPTAAGSNQHQSGIKQKVSEDEAVVSGERRTITKGHLDIGPKMIDGAWRAAVRDDTSAPPKWRSLDDVVVHLSDTALMDVPPTDDYAFLKIAAGERVWVIPQTQNPDVPWVGWNTQDPAALARMGRGAKLTLKGASGPAPVSIFMQDGSFGKPRQLWDSAKTEPQDIWMEANTHTHANWIFPKPGVYVLSVDVSATQPDGQNLTAPANLRFAVGAETTPDAAFAAPAPHAGTATSAATARPVNDNAAAQKTAADADISNTNTWLLTGVGIALAAMGAVAVVGVRRRKAMQSALEARYEKVR